MAHLRYYSYPGFGEAKREELWYSQAVRIGSFIELAGQGTYLSRTQPLITPLTTTPGGWDPMTSQIPSDFDDEIDQAFANVEYALKHAGGQGWSQVYKIRLYLTDLGEASVMAAVRNLKKWLPGHRPILTCIGVSQLGLPGMRVEIEVVAHDVQGAEGAAAAKVSV
jgi:enamine deaminase RidA (YjgF/YER057c/UK114 family)